MRRAFSLACIVVAVLLATSVRASNLPDAFTGVGVEPALGTAIPTDTPFLDENGDPVHLSDYLGGPPVILAPVYFNCPNLCGSTLDDLVFALQRMPLTPERDYRVVAVSFDPRERPADAARTKNRALAGSPPELQAAAHFLTGPESSSAALMRALGFLYRWDEPLQQYAHVSGVALLTRDGRLACWLAGVGLQPGDLRLAIAEAGRSGIAGMTDRFLLLCAHYDPRTGRYTSFVEAALKIAGALTIIVIAVPIALALWRERRQRARTLVR